MQELAATIYSGHKFDTNIAVITPRDTLHLLAVWCLCSSPEYNETVRQIDQSLKVTDATLVKVPFDLAHWQKVADEKYPNGLPKPYSDDPTQWSFHGHPVPSEQSLQVAVARLLGYLWPAELDPEMELSDEARAWVKQCEDLLDLADQDGILCIPSVRGEEAAVDRLEQLLARAYGPDWSTARLRQLLDAAGANASDLEDWLRNHFFEQHCKLFRHRPFMAPDLPTGEKGADIPGGKTGAGALRWKPNIHWEKDRGKDVASSPW